MGDIPDNLSLWRRYVAMMDTQPQGSLATVEFAYVKSALNRSPDDACRDRQIIRRVREIKARLRHGGSDNDRRQLAELQGIAPELAAAVMEEGMGES